MLRRTKMSDSNYDKLIQIVGQIIDIADISETEVREQAKVWNSELTESDQMDADFIDGACAALRLFNEEN
jgi:hypothetical protein